MPDRIGGAVLFVLTVFAASGAAAAELPASAPLPPSRPGAPSGAGDEASAAVPLPPPRPDDLAPPATAAPEERAPAPAEPAPAPAGPAPAPAGPAPAPAEPALPAAEAACRAHLSSMGVAYEALPPIADGACGAPHPILVSRLPDGIAVTPPATLTCPAAEVLAEWTHEDVVRAAAADLGATVKAVAIGTSYECRSQNRAAGAKLSEHAFANGVDVSGFSFDGHGPVAIGTHPAGSPEAGFQAAIRAKACDRFATVLGPGQPSHDTHLHLDMRERKRGYRICQ